MNRNRRCLILMSTLFLALFMLGNGAYILPVPDGGEQHPSPPSIVGRLKIVSANEIAVLPEGATSLIIVKITKETNMFTTAGGYVPIEKLVLDGSIEVWFTLKSLNNKLYPPVAAVVRVEARKAP